jgi:CRP-like cAMP-binding protein
MELTLESAFSTGGLVGHTSYLLLVISMLMRTMFWLRIFVIASALVAITYDAVWLKDPIGVFWETTLLIVSLVQNTLLWRENRVARFSPEERFFLDTRLRGMAEGEARRLIDAGAWADLSDGEVLTVEGQPPTHLSFVASGRIGIHVDGRRVAECGPGAFVGEMSLVDEGTASATARVEDAARIWRIPVARLESLRQSRPEQTAALDASIARDIRGKLVALNRKAGTSERQRAPLPGAEGGANPA